jgi:4-hydroxythreonine-4-phosphate dehydrogenase
MNSNPGLLAVSMGDPAGIGPEIVARALASPDSGRCVVIGDVGVMRRAPAAPPARRRHCPRPSPSPA